MPLRVMGGLIITAFLWAMAYLAIEAAAFEACERYGYRTQQTVRYQDGQCYVLEAEKKTEVWK